MFTLKQLFAILMGTAFQFRFGDDDGGGGDDDDKGGKKGEAKITPEIQKLIDDQVKGLKDKNNELLDSMKKAKESLKRFDGIDPDAVNAMLKRFADDEEAGLIKEGKIDEVLNRRTDRMKAEHQKQLEAMSGEVSKAAQAKAKLAERAVKAEVIAAANKAGALPEAMDDIFLRAKGVFTVNEDGEVVAMNGDEVIMGKDGKTPLSPLEWAESLRESATHLWPKGTGTGAPGAKNGSQHAGKGNIGGSKQERQAAIASKFPDLPAK
ncbi:hypothetical protein [Methylovorus glucosotrophus]|uniref:Phage protein n=1 Tax=Methylovorus glucosotrophus (strain SIP3-4) TaxID=582744 RepID=C6XE97_METGS|nr:hypothetical protein [Methylovorus glucosotrophus]ACT50872.1 phage protein [Methylovorus glucosotrophus SIP3-4]